MSGKRQVAEVDSDLKQDSSHDQPVAKKTKIEQLETEKHSSTSSPSSPSSPSNDTNVSTTCSTSTLYVSNLHNRVAEPHLEKLFQRFGEINRVSLIRRMGKTHSLQKDSTTASHRKFQQKHPTMFSYAFVEFKSLVSANQAMNALNGVTLLGKDLIVKAAHSKTGQGFSNGVCVGEGVGEKELTSEEMKKKKSDVESKIDALKRALREKEKK